MTTTIPAGTGRRADGRVPNQLRPVKIVPDYLKFAEGSVLIRVGDTRVLCAATIEDRVPGWMRGKGRGWVTAEYSMLPRAGTERSQREAARGAIGGRTHEIQRLTGQVAAVSVGMVNGAAHLDLDYSEDSTAEVDFNVVMTDDDRLIEVQGTAEHGAFTRQQMDAMVDLAAAGIRQLFTLQKSAIEAPPGE